MHSALFNSTAAPDVAMNGLNEPLLQLGWHRPKHKSGFRGVVNYGYDEWCHVYVANQLCCILIFNF